MASGKLPPRKAASQEGPLPDLPVGAFLAVTAQLGLVLAVIWLFQIEQGHGLAKLAPWIFGGFVAHAVLPLRFRQPFFLALSLACFFVLLGTNALWLIGIGLGLIGLCHLPIPHRARVALVVAATIGLSLIRLEVVETSWGVLVLPILGAIFMFRLAVYLYDIRHERKPASLWTRLSYFFMLPNVTFLLFPVIDYQTFKRTYYNKPSAEIYQKGILWVFRGVTHLIAYRLIYYYLVPTPSAVVDLAGVVQSMLTTYLLYLRISGQFHLIIGLMCLFGYNLPETHHLYYLASSFSDYWRRINIYWKDFMMKLFFYPAMTRLKHLSMTTKLAWATLWVFFGTWILHSYQWFWLRAEFPLTAPDGAFWGILGLLVVVNSVYEAKKGRQRTLSKPEWRFQTALVYSLKVLGMFVFITFLWSLWSSPTLGAFWALVSAAGGSPAMQWVVFWAVMAALALLGVGAQYLTYHGYELSLTGQNPSFKRSAAFTSIGAVLLLLLGLPQVKATLGAEGAEFVTSLQEVRFNQRDEELLERGYYEGLLETTKFNNVLAEINQNKPKSWGPIGTSEAAQPTDDLRRYALVPGAEIVFKEQPLRINRWGMHDRDYTKEKPEGVYRIALLGASYEMGGGIPADSVLDNVTEALLNTRHAGGVYAGFEVLNFAVGGYTLLDNVVVSEKLVFDFAPDAVYYTGHSVEEFILFNRLVNVFQAQQPLPPFLQQVHDEAGIEASMEAVEIKRRLAPHADALVLWGYRQIVAQARAAGALPVWVFVPRTDDEGDDLTVSLPRFQRLAEAAGFAATLNLAEAYGDGSRTPYQLALWDKHANAAGHRRLGRKLYDEMVAHQAALQLDLTAAPATVSLAPQP